MRNILSNKCGSTVILVDGILIKIVTFGQTSIRDEVGTLYGAFKERQHREWITLPGTALHTGDKLKSHSKRPSQAIWPSPGWKIS